MFDQNAAQQSIFDQVVQQLIDGCLQGYNATILAYGQVDTQIYLPYICHKVFVHR